MFFYQFIYFLIPGFHHYYLKRPFWGLAYTFTFGFLGIGWLVDGCRLSGLVKSTNTYIETSTYKQLMKKKMDAHIIHLFPFIGVFGFQHYYLDRHIIALFYSLSLGNFGVGWIVDFFRLSDLVNEYNKKLENYESG